MIQAEDTKTIDMPLPKAEPDHTGTLQLVRIDDVEALPQVRTESGMDEKSLDELAASIMARGLLQPPLLRTQTDSDKLAIVAGHRRIAAMRRAGFETCYAIVGTTDADSAHEMQIAENIHREQLSPLEIGNAVAFLLAKHKQLSKVAAILKKSKPWCSKHLAVTLPDFSKVAKDMLKSGECEDLEILGIINQLDKMGCHDDIQALRDNPPLTRAKARAALKLAKAEDSGQHDEETEEPPIDHKEEEQAAKDKAASDLGNTMALIIPALDNAWHMGDVKDAQSLVNELGMLLHSHANGRNPLISRLFELVTMQTKDAEPNE
jgi:ParB/RepB/Spo0J family partition protein